MAGVVNGRCDPVKRHRLLTGNTDEYYVSRKRTTESAMTTTITTKGQVTLPKAVRDATGLKPGDRVEVRATASGGVYIAKPETIGQYRKRLEALAKRRIIRGVTTDAYMKMVRGDPDEDGDR
jgi:antitoxin PrlF